MLGFLMAMFNVRLGAWLGNTNSHGDRTYRHPGPRQAIEPLFAEMFGLTHSERGYVNLSDGGHFDNLGLYEVVLRRCSATFPHEPTADQWFSESQFENYRALGAHIVAQLTGDLASPTDTRFTDFYSSIEKCLAVASQYPP
jgi:hypothetical protein